MLPFSNPMGKRDESKASDPRTKALAKTWEAGFGILALCIPLVIITKSPLIPIMAILGLAVVAMYVWRTGDKGDRSSEAAFQAENEELRAKLKELEERLANVEVINRFEDRLAEKQLRKAAERPGLPSESVRSAGLESS